MSEDVPLGDLVEDGPALAPERRVLEGKYTKLVPVDVSQARALYRQLCNPAKPSIFTYLHVGPFNSEESFARHIETIAPSTSPIYYTVMPKQALAGIPAETPAGYLSLMNIDLTHRRIEIGSIAFSPSLQRTTVATEALYLAMKYCMEDLGNRRLEWKCDCLNAKSKRAAERVGFTYEGLFRNHMIIRSRNRDTSWYSILKKEWPNRRLALEAWLAAENFEGGKQIKSLQQIRDEKS